VRKGRKKHKKSKHALQPPSTIKKSLAAAAFKGGENDQSPSEQRTSLEREKKLKVGTASRKESKSKEESRRRNDEILLSLIAEGIEINSKGRSCDILRRGKLQHPRGEGPFT